MALSTEDRLEILDLAARYNHYIDGGEPESWAATFTADGVFDSPMGAFEGTDALVGFAKGFNKDMAGTEHWVNNQVVDGDGEQATHRCYLQLIKTESGESLGRLRYTDDLVKQDDKWKFTRRVVR